MTVSVWEQVTVSAWTLSVWEQVTDFAEQAEAWTRSQAAANPHEDLWRAVGTVAAVVAITLNSLCRPCCVLRAAPVCWALCVSAWL